MPSGIYKRTKPPWNKGKKTGYAPWLGKKRPDISAMMMGHKMHPGSEKGWFKLKQSPSYIDGRSKTKEYRRWLCMKRKARLHENGGLHSFEEWLELKVKYNLTCPACLQKEPDVLLTRDHVIPLSRGGNDDIENIQPLCRPCNTKKFTKTIKYELVTA